MAITQFALWKFALFSWEKVDRDIFFLVTILRLQSMLCSFDLKNCVFFTDMQSERMVLWSNVVEYISRMFLSLLMLTFLILRSVPYVSQFMFQSVFQMRIIILKIYLKLMTILTW